MEYTSDYFKFKECLYIAQGEQNGISETRV